jgi:hypothetical protein
LVCAFCFVTNALVIPKYSVCCASVSDFSDQTSQVNALLFEPFGWRNKLLSGGLFIDKTNLLGYIAKESRWKSEHRIAD